ncbi:hypothetical protein [Mycolicibacterium sp.]|uniref:hypothetical protein n=1 Tax=Mycolicibacterium sp. TaxID=2320850 RepID=UPI003D0A40E0
MRSPTASVWRGRHRLPFAICQCGWRGGSRLLARAAARDAHRHAAQTGHELSEPLDLWRARRRSR